MLRIAMGNADILSPCPSLPQQSEGNTTEEVLMIEWAGPPLVSAQSLALQTKKDAHLSKVLNWVLRGWPNGKVDSSDQFYSYFCRRHELSANKGILVWGNWAVIPEPSRPALLQALHASHPGIVKMNAMARSYIWWPNIDAEIEHVAISVSKTETNSLIQLHTIGNLPDNLGHAFI
ncbi:uncharacterized protein K02A2.6-like [Drosophila willistoni]|uniref:uncharacterized protein K02A2.6-like n=1 Tax=Drosophila willistoni TaxID=7260 RepID=UPI001F078F72|nr:uncharacterized protein K02A2.6-like [Drosophila willistoni]